MENRLFSRRNMLLCVGAAVAGLPSLASATATIKPETRLDKLVSKITPRLDLVNVHTDEKISLRYHGPTGYDLDAIRKINWLMRDWRQDELVQMDVRLFWALSAIRMAAINDGHSGVMYLLSGYRTEKTNRMLAKKNGGVARNSLHLEGKASDITMEGVSIKALADYATWLQVGGVGSYRRSNFVHIDSGRTRRWG